MGYIYVNGAKVHRNDNITKNFKYKELQSKDGSRVMHLNLKAVYLLQELRDGLGVPIIINSAYRSPTHNANVGGARYSRHLYGDAFDIRVNGYTPLEIANFAKGLGFTGVSAYNTFTHIDTRPGGFVSWGKYKDQIVAKPLPYDKDKEDEKPESIEYRFVSDFLKFKLDDEIIEVQGIKRYVGDSYSFEQFIAVRDLEVLGFIVDWENGQTVIRSGGQKRKANLNLKYDIETLTGALVKVKYKEKELTYESHILYDKNGNISQFLPIKGLKKLDFDLKWDKNGQFLLLKYKKR